MSNQVTLQNTVTENTVTEFLPSQHSSSTTSHQVEMKVMGVVNNASSSPLKTGQSHPACRPRHFSSNNSAENVEGKPLAEPRIRSRSTPMSENEKGRIIRQSLPATPTTTSEDQKPRSRYVNYKFSSSERSHARGQPIVTSSEHHKKKQEPTFEERQQEFIWPMNAFSNSSFTENPDDEPPAEPRTRSRSTPMSENEKGRIIRQSLPTTITITSEEQKLRSSSVNHTLSSSERPRAMVQHIVTNSEHHKKKQEPSFEEEKQELFSLLASMRSEEESEHEYNLSKESVTQIAQQMRQLNSEILNQFDSVLQNHPKYRQVSGQIQKTFKQLCEQTTQFYEKIDALNNALQNPSTYFVLNKKRITKVYLCNALGVYLHKENANKQTIKKNDEYNFVRLIHTKEGEHLAKALHKHFANHYELFKAFLEVSDRLNSTFSIQEGDSLLWIDQKENDKTSRILANEIVMKLPQELIVDFNLCCNMKDHLQSMIELREQLPYVQLSCRREKRGIDVIERWVQILSKGQNQLNLIYNNGIKT